MKTRAARARDRKQLAPGPGRGTNNNNKRRRKAGDARAPEQRSRSRNRRGLNARSSHNSTGTHPESGINASIEDELRQQRERQQLKSQDESHSQRQKVECRPPKVMGNFRYDCTRNAYFPKESLHTLNDSKTSTGNQVISSSKSTKHAVTGNDHPSDPIVRYLWQKPQQNWRRSILSYMAEISPSASLRTSARDYWAGRSLYDSMVIVPAATPTINGNGEVTWNQLYPTNEQNKSNDLVCKRDLHPSSRTFDVAVNESSTGAQSLPAIVTFVDSDRIQYRSGLSNRATTMKHSGGQAHSVRFIPSVDKPRGVAAFLTTKGCTHNSLSMFSIFDYVSGGSEDDFFYLRGHIDGLQNDFAISGDTIMFAPDRVGSPVSTVRYYTGGLNGRQTWAHPENSGFPQAGALCIEGRPRTSGSFVMGHRNGQLSFHDTREGSRHVLATKKPRIGSNRSTDFGAATAITCLSDGNQVLTRGSFGVCRLHDVRKLGQCYDVAGDSSGSSMIWNLSCPKSVVADAGPISSCCNGIALNPSQTIAISPVLNACGNPSLAMWSLHSAQYIGVKELTCATRGAMRSKEDLPYMELCSTTTPAYTMTESQGTTRQQGGGFGLWLKCGRSLLGPDSPIPPQNESSTCHVTFDGSFDGGSYSEAS